MSRSVFSATGGISHPNLILFIILLSLTSACLAAQKPCFFPNGGVADEYVPCNDTAEVTFCCAPGNVCLSNKFCVNVEKVIGPGGVLGLPSRGACTDRGWVSNDCPKFCYQDVFNANRAGTALPCGANMYCCQEDGNATACCGNKEFVGISPVHFMKQIPLNTTNNNTSFGDLFPSPASVGPAMVTSTSKPKAKSTPLPAAKPNSNSTQPSQSSQSSRPSNSSLGRSLGLGLGLGIPLGLILSGFIFWCLRGRRGFRDSPNPEKMHHKHAQKAKRQAVEMSGSHFWQPPKEMDVPAPRYSIQKPFGFPERFVGNTRGDSPPNALNRMASYHGEHRGSTGWG